MATAQKKMTTVQKKKAATALNKTLKEQFSGPEIEEMAWFTDIEGDGTYAWKFEFEGEIRTYVYHLWNGKVVIWA